MSYTIAVAAAVAGTDVATILRAIETGELTASKDARGEWRIVPAELDRVYPPIAARGAVGSAPPPSPADLADVAAEIEAMIRQAGDRLRQQLDAVEHARGGPRPQPEWPRPPDPSGRRRWWRRMVG